jgi:hypothetical protein
MTPEYLQSLRTIIREELTAMMKQSSPKLPWSDMELEHAEMAVRKGDRRAVARYIETHERRV